VGDYDRAAGEARRAIEEAERCGDTATLGKAHYVLARIGFWVGPYTDGVEHGRRAVALLEDHREGLWLGQSHWAVGINHLFMGSFDAALESAHRAHAIGDAIGDPRLQTYSDWCIGWIEATSGAWETGLEACQRSLARSRDAFNTACALGWSGFAYLQGGDPASAIPLLEQSIEHWTRIGYRGILGWFNAWLSDALRLRGEIERARQVAVQAVEIGRAVKNPYAPARAQRVLGRIALVEGALAEAERHLTEAREAFASAESRFELGETLLALGELARAQGKPEVAAAHLAEARVIFTSLGCPRYVELTERIGRDAGLQLAEDDAPSTRSKLE
jgi:tetratricopeptide (TPR) repeat protein